MGGVESTPSTKFTKVMISMMVDLGHDIRDSNDSSKAIRMADYYKTRVEDVISLYTDIDYIFNKMIERGEEIEDSDIEYIIRKIEKIATLIEDQKKTVIDIQKYIDELGKENYRNVIKEEFKRLVAHTVDFFIIIDTVITSRNLVDANLAISKLIEVYKTSLETCDEPPDVKKQVKFSLTMAPYYDRISRCFGEEAL